MILFPFCEKPRVLLTVVSLVMFGANLLAPASVQPAPGIAQSQELSPSEARNQVEVLRRTSGTSPAQLAAALTQLAQALLEDPEHDGGEAEAAAREALELQTSLEAGSSATAQAHYQLARALERQGKPQDARRHYEQAVKMWIDALGPEDPRVADGLQGLATTLLTLGQVDYARQFFGQALDIRAKSYGAMHPLVAETLFSQAQLLGQIGQDGEAMRLFQQALAIRQTSLGVNHPLVADTLLEIGRLLVFGGELEKALEPLQQALMIRRQFSATEPLRVADIEYELGRALVDLRRRDQARPLLEHAVEVRRQWLPPDHPDLARALSALGKCLRDDDRSDAALPYFKEASQIFVAAHGEQDFETIISLNSLATVYRDLSRLSEARPLMEKIVNLWEQVEGVESPYWTQAVSNLAELNWSLGRYDAAADDFNKACQATEKRIGDSPQLATCLERMGRMLTDGGRYSAAGAVLERALQIRRALPGTNSMQLADSLSKLGRLRSLEGQYPAAESLLREAASVLEENSQYGAALAGTLDLLAGVKERQADFDAARELQERALELRRKAYGDDHPQVAVSLNALGNLKRSQGDYGGARELYQQALQIMEKFYGPDHPQVAASLGSLANLYLELGNPAAARPLFERALGIWEQTFGSRHPRVATALNDLANTLRRQAQYDQAQELYRRAQAIWIEAVGKESPQYAASLNNLGSLAYDAGRFADSIRYYEEALEIQRKLVGQSHPDVATAFNNLAEALRAAGQYERAGELFQQALDIRRNVLGESHPLVAASLNNYARFLAELGRFDQAVPLLQEAIQKGEAQLGPDHPDVASSLSNLAGLYAQEGRLDEALPLYQRVLEIRRQSLGPNHPEVAISLNNLAELYRDGGDFVKARKLYQEAIQIWRQAWGEDHPDVATGLANLADLLASTGDYRESRELHLQALTIRERVLGPEHPEVAASLNSLAVVLRNLGDNEEAEKLLRRALNIRKQALGDSGPEVALNLSSLANTLRREGRFAEAASNYAEALKILEQAYGANHLSVAATVNSLAILKHQTGDRQGALQLYQRALSIWRQYYGDNHPNIAAGLSNLSVLEAELGQPEKAFTDALTAEEISRSHLQLTIRTLPERQALRYAQVRASGLDLAFSLSLEKAQQLPEALRETWDSLVHSRAVVLDEMARRRRSIQTSHDPEVSRLAAQLKAAGERLARLTIQGPGQASSEDFRQELEQTRREKERVEEELAQKSVDLRRQLEARTVGLAQVLPRLPADSVLLAFAHYRHYPLDSGQATGFAYLALIGRPDGSIQSVPLGPAAQIDHLVSRWHKEAARGILTQLWSREEAEQFYREAGTRLRERIWDPLLPYLNNAQRVFVVPDGAINLVSFQSLPLAAGGYLVEQDPVIHYLSAERDLVAALADRPTGHGLLAIGGANFDLTRSGAMAALEEQIREDEATPCSQFDLIEFDALPGAGDEAQEIADFWKQYSDDPSQAIHLSGSAASEAEFKRLAPGRRVLHLATHGFILGSTCAGAGEDVLAASGLSVPEESDEPVIDNPLLRSGLALAGANHRDMASDASDDGILTAEEVAGLDLSATQWAVLSACNTAAGKVQAGEGVLGLRRAFQVAGAGTLIMSLWPVEDLSTRQLMKNLYRARLQAGLDTARSLQQAQRELLSQLREQNQVTHPFFWGAFVAAGDWR